MLKFGLHACVHIPRPYHRRRLLPTENVEDTLFNDGRSRSQHRVFPASLCSWAQMGEYPAPLRRVRMGFVLNKNGADLNRNITPGEQAALHESLTWCRGLSHCAMCLRAAFLDPPHFMPLRTRKSATPRPPGY